MNTNTEEWGNIELPGLSDEKLFKTNWTLVAANREVVKKREQNGWYKKNAEAHKNKDMKSLALKISVSAKLTRKKEGWKEDWMSTIDKRNNDKEYQLKTLEGIQKRTQSKEWQEKNKEARKKSLKPIVTPFGIFASIKEAIKQIDKSEGWIMKKRKTHPKEYYLISQEEYIMLTGQNPFE